MFSYPAWIHAFWERLGSFGSPVLARGNCPLPCYALLCSAHPIIWQNRREKDEISSEVDTNNIDYQQTHLLITLSTLVWSCRYTIGVMGPKHKWCTPSFSIGFCMICPSWWRWRHVILTPIPTTKPCQVGTGLWGYVLWYLTVITAHIFLFSSQLSSQLWSQLTLSIHSMTYTFNDTCRQQQQQQQQQQHIVNHLRVYMQWQQSHQTCAGR